MCPFAYQKALEEAGNRFSRTMTSLKKDIINPVEYNGQFSFLASGIKQYLKLAVTWAEEQF